MANSRQGMSSTIVQPIESYFYLWFNLFEGEVRVTYLFNCRCGHLSIAWATSACKVQFSYGQILLYDAAGCALDTASARLVVQIPHLLLLGGDLTSAKITGWSCSSLQP
ncbi:hypothetical protein M758_UG207600 [Ceratodon purpureus]|nr:hypothetical protein M758_UG207600 [Ceratodon purpureus]